MAAECELADLYLAERLPAWRVRQAVCDSAPDGVRVAGLHDVWLGAPALAASVVAAEYRIALAGDAACDAAAIRAAATTLLAATTLERRRQRGSDSVVYDLRPLLDAIDVRDTQPTELLVRTRFNQERGAGRPEEVVAALADSLATPLSAASIVRQRILLADDLAASATFDARLA